MQSWRVRPLRSSPIKRHKNVGPRRLLMNVASRPMERLLILALPFFGPIIIGYIAGRTLKRPDAGMAWLNFFVIYVALPPVFYQLISKTPPEQLTKFAFAFSTLFSSYTAFAIAFGLAFLLLRGHVREAVVAGGIGGYGNVGYMGPGLALALFGNEAAAPMAIIFCGDCVLFFAIIPFLLALHEDRSNLVDTLKTIFKRVFLNPFIIATMLGVAGAFTGLKLPAAIDRTLSFLTGAAAPSALFALGVTVALRPLGRVPAELPATLAVKLILHPLIVYLVLSLIGPFDRIWVYTAMMMAALPPALSVFVLATQYQTYVERSSTAVLIGTACSVPTLLVWLYLLENKLIPVSLFAGI